MFKVGKYYKLKKDRPGWQGRGWPFYELEILNKKDDYDEHSGYLQIGECFLSLSVTSIDAGYRKMLKILFKEKIVLIFCSNERVNDFEEL